MWLQQPGYSSRWVKMQKQLRARSLPSPQLGRRLPATPVRRQAAAARHRVAVDDRRRRRVAAAEHGALHKDQPKAALQ